jgi:hypothetical protein
MLDVLYLGGKQKRMETDFTNRTEGEVDMSETLVNYIEIGSPSDYHKLNSPNLVEFDSVLYDNIIKACNDYVDRPNRECANRDDGFMWRSCEFGHECSERWGDEFRPFNKHYDGNFDGEFSIHSVVIDLFEFNCSFLYRMSLNNYSYFDIENDKHDFVLSGFRTFLIKYSNSKDAIYFTGFFHSQRGSISLSCVNSPNDFFEKIKSKINKCIEEAKPTAQRLIKEDERIKNDGVFKEIWANPDQAFPTIIVLLFILVSFLNCSGNIIYLGY